LATPQTQTQLTTWELDPSHTLVEFSTRHMMVTTVKGRFTSVKGTITTDMADHSKAGVEVTIDAASITTNDEKRDGHLKSPDFLDVANYPTITFKSTRVVSESADSLTVVGDLTVHGVTKSVELKTELNGQGTTPYGAQIAGFTATTSINRKDFGLNWNVALEAGGWLVGEQIKIAIEGEAVKKA
jgi:polyisoprenoid-binding protein YceI